MYIFDSRVRYSEVSNDKKINIASIVDYFQDCSTFQSEALGVGIEYLKEKGIAWVLNSWQIVVDRYVELGEKISVGTKAYDFKGIYGYRNFCLIDENKDIAVKANSIWVLINTKTGMPMKLTEEECVPYGKEEKLDMDYADRKIKIEGEGIEQDCFSVKKYHIDTNGHVNNAQYIKFAQEYLMEDFTVYMVRVEYKMEAKYGNNIYPVVYSNKDKLIASLNNEDGKPYAVVEFIRQIK
ncbi:MAG: acyl-[acyl-carrier-protein] thioesterase [Lachnospiraceae bacterium]|nr:acyl-[acyl-carrier-protein] thioesterase [Lachnospiraceae bacterium]